MNAMHGYSLLSATVLLLFISLDSWSNAQIASTRESILEKQTDFALDLLRLANNKSNNKAVVISPSSVAMMLSMLIKAAVNETRDDLTRAMGSGLALHKHYSELISKRGSLRIVNKLYSNAGQTFSKSYSDFIKRYYGSGIVRQNFTDVVKTVNMINSYVSRKTSGVIRDIVSPDNFNDELEFFAVNVLSFINDWEVPFNKNYTKEYSFFNSATEPPVKTSFMVHRDVKFYNDKDLTCLALPFNGRNVTAYFILPPTTDEFGLNKLIEGLTTKKLNEVFAKLEEKRLKRTWLYLPRFNQVGENDITELLSNKLPIALSDNSQYSKFSPTFTITEMKQAAALEWNEDGATAAVNQPNDEGTSAAPTVTEPPIILPKNLKAINANRPFLTLFVEQSQAILLSAIVRM